MGRRNNGWIWAVWMLLAGAAGAENRVTVWTGVYSAAQSERGEAAYDHDCSSCHYTNLTAYGSVLVGEPFMDRWREDSLESFYNIVKTTMPRGAPASLSTKKYLDIVAFVLKANGFPAGKGELREAALKSIAIEGKDGPKPVPEFALVKTVGCLVQTAGGEWILEGASAAARTRNPEASTPAELERSAGLSGSGVVHFLRMMPYDVKALHVDLQKGHKVEVKGLLIRKDGRETLNVTSIATVQAVCSR